MWNFWHTKTTSNSKTDNTLIAVIDPNDLILTNLMKKRVQDHFNILNLNWEACFDMSKSLTSLSIFFNNTHIREHMSSHEK